VGDANGACDLIGAFEPDALDVGGYLIGINTQDFARFWAVISVDFVGLMRGDAVVLQFNNRQPLDTILLKRAASVLNQRFFQLQLAQPLWLSF